MRIREIIFQGVFGCDSPVRLATAPGVDRMNLPADLCVEDVHGLVIALFYPQKITDELNRQFEVGDNVKLAVVLEQGDRVYRVLRRQELSSMRLQVKKPDGFKGLARGHQASVAALEEHVGIPDFETFVALNLWRFGDDEIYARGGDRLSQEHRDLVEKYRIALRAESLEDRIKNLEGRIAETRGALGKGAKIDEKLEQARAKLESLQMSDLSEEDFELLSDKEERFADFDNQLDRLLRQEDEERVDIERKLPDRPWKDSVFWAGLVVGVAALAVSIAMHETLRQVAALNVVGFGMVAWVLLRYFADLERASVHQVRLESIKRRLNQVREEEVAFREQINHLLIHAGVDDEHELYERFEKTRKLERIIEQLEAKAAEVRRDPSYKSARAEIDQLDDEIERLSAEREQLPEVVMSSFQLEDDLKSLGLDPTEVLEEDDEEPEEIPQTTFGRLKLAAERHGQWQGGRLQTRTRKMWGKICGHVLGSRFKGVDLGGDGELKVRDLSDEQLAMWRRTRTTEERIVAAALALALHVNIRDRAGRLLETIWVSDPRDDFGSKVADAFDDVFDSAAKKSHIVLCHC
ncbi:MAG: hypothetical protein ACLFVJ_01355 [Persicimonas sp.]